MKTDWIQTHSREWINPLHVERVHVIQNNPQGHWQTNISMTSGKSYHLYIGDDEDEARIEAQKVIEKLSRYIRNTLHIP